MDRATRWAELAKANPQARTWAEVKVNEIHITLSWLWATMKVPADLIPDVLEEAFEQFMGMDFEPTLPEARVPDGDKATMLYNDDVASEWIKAVLIQAGRSGAGLLTRALVAVTSIPQRTPDQEQLLADLRAEIASQKVSADYAERQG